MASKIGESIASMNDERAETCLKSDVFQSQQWTKKFELGPWGEKLFTKVEFEPLGNFINPFTLKIEADRLLGIGKQLAELVQ